MNVRVRRGWGAFAVALCLLVLFGANWAAAGTSQNDKKKKKNQPAAESDSSPIVALSDEQQIDYMISEVLGAWQIGDTERMHKNYVDDVSVVNGGWAPPIIGWSNYQTMYKQQRATMQQVRMDRSNTYIKVNGATAWACYQWEFAGVVNGTPSAARGLTTYVLVKKDGRWLIAHDHTSVVQSFQQPATSAPAGTSPPEAGLPQKPAN
jgi:uncharacterized protein (TIGR02246 family)